MSTFHQVVIEKNKKFSESYLWNYQREYFDREGIDAWVKEVPHYVTSNPFLADCYAQMTVRLAQDWVKKYPDAKNHPFYVIELGTGSGQLSFYIMKKIKQLKEQLQLHDLNICYVMTDFTQSNINFWDQHPVFQEFLEDKSLDFALYNLEKDTSLTLQKNGVTLAPGSVVNPITVFSNYVFDTVSHDAFTVKNGQLYASLVSLTTESRNIKNGKPEVLENVNITYHAEEIGENYYDNPAFNTVLNKYKHLLHHSQILFPIAGLKAVDNLRKLSNDKMFLVSTDKGYSFIDEMEGLDYPYVAFHGSFSMMVNFHAIADYFEITGGQSYIQSQRTDIKTNAFYSGFDLKDFPEFALSLYQNVERLSPGDYFILHRNISENFPHCNINTLAAHMAFTHWDPHIYKKLHRQVCEQLPRAERSTIEYFKNHMADMAGNFFYMPETHDIPFDIGFLLHTLNFYAEAIPYYEKSKQYFGERYHLIYNIAICQHKAGLLDEALVNFKYALTLNPEAEEAQRYVEYLEKQMAS